MKHFENDYVGANVVEEMAYVAEKELLTSLAKAQSISVRIESLSNYIEEELSKANIRRLKLFYDAFVMEEFSAMTEEPSKGQGAKNEIAPGLITALFVEAESLLRNKQFDAARNIFARIVSEHPTSHESKILVRLKEYFTSDKGSANSTPLSVQEVEKMHEGLQALEGLAETYRKGNPEARRTLDAIFGLGIFQTNRTMSLEVLAGCMENLEQARNEALSGR